MSSILSADILNTTAGSIATVTVSLAVLIKVFFDSRESLKARQRLIEAEKLAFHVTQDADISELASDLSQPKRMARDAARHAQSDSMNAAKLSDLYSKQIEKYQTDTQARASWSFFFAVFAMLGGLGFVVWGGTHLLISPGWEHVAGATAIAGIGGGIGAFIAKTFLDVHRLSLSQLNHYFRQPVVNAHVLTGQRLADQLVEVEARQRGYELLLQRVAELIREESTPGAVWSATDTGTTSKVPAKTNEPEPPNK